MNDDERKLQEEAWEEEKRLREEAKKLDEEVARGWWAKERTRRGEEREPRRSTPIPEGVWLSIDEQRLDATPVRIVDVKVSFGAVFVISFQVFLAGAILYALAWGLFALVVSMTEGR